MRRLSENVERLVQKMDDIEDSLIAPATGRKQVPLMTHLIIVFSISIALLVSNLADSNRDFKLKFNEGLDLTRSHNEQHR